MILSDAIEELRRDVSLLELTESAGVVLDQDWPNRMKAVIESHDRFVAAATGLHRSWRAGEIHGNATEVIDLFVALDKLKEEV